MNRGKALASAALLGGLAATTPARAEGQNNILLIILDDVGVDMITAYKGLVGSESVPATPTIDELAAEGILFTNVWAGPSCAPTRATIQTGQYNYRIGSVPPGYTLNEGILGLADVFNVNSALGYQKAMIGKWGLRNPEGDPINVSDIRHVIMSGYDYFVGKPGCCFEENGGYFAYLDASAQFSSACDSTDPAAYQIAACITCPIVGQDAECVPPSVAASYATTENVNDAINWIATRPDGQSWFLTLSLNAAHTPFHAPPDGLWTATDPGPDTECLDTPLTQQTCYRAAVEAADTEIGRLLDAMDENEKLETTILVLGDNGSIGQHDAGTEGVSVAPFDPTRAKQTLYEGGIRVPLIAYGKSVPLELDAMGKKMGRESAALVNTSDLFATILEIAGVDLEDLPADPFTGGVAPDIDSYSLVPILTEGCSSDCTIESIRRYAYSEANWHDRRGKTIRNRLGYKLVLHQDGFSRMVPGEPLPVDRVVPGLEFYYLGGDPSPLVSGLEDEREDHDLWIDATSELDEGRLTEPQIEYLQPIFDDLIQRLGPEGQPPNIAAVHKCDVNRDGRIDSADALRVMQLAVSGAGDPGEVARADVAPPNPSKGGDGDGAVDSADVLLILRAISGDDVISCDHTLI